MVSSATDAKGCGLVENGDDSTATVVIGTDCGTSQPTDANSAVYTNPPLGDILVNFRDAGSGETTGTIDCEPQAGVDTPDGTPHRVGTPR